MLFNSIEYSFFLPVVFLLYWFVFNRNLKLQNLFIVIVSCFFYGWWDWRFLGLLVFTSLCTYASGLLIEKYKDIPRKAKMFSALNIIVNLLILGVFKYYNFFATSFADAFLGGKTDGLLLKAILPVGISFYTFKALSYSIDVYRGKQEATRDVIQLLAYVSFFPQLLAGPIERATNLLPQFGKPRVFEYETGVDGLRQILWGLFKKVVVADNCAVFVNQVFSSYQTQSGSTLLLAAVFYAFQIYGDFSGYSDMAIGTGKLFGFKTKQNFSVPYFSRDIAEFWRRWHISLTTWFRDYVYIPLGGSRCSKAKIVRNTFIIFLVSGLWHGANWTFIAWGAYHALLFLPLILLGKNRKYRDVVAVGRLLPTIKELGQMLLTFFLVVIGWIIFRADSIGQAWDYMGRMFSSSLFTRPDAAGVTGFSVAIFCMILAEWLQRTREHGLDLHSLRYPVVRYALDMVVVFLVIVLGGHSENFIYFQF
ncbi:MAG: MBOAT family protein [Bacteroidales bacterium]|nr:MBOAT family protein [Bacteroidales bacterium]